MKSSLSFLLLFSRACIAILSLCMASLSWAQSNEAAEYKWNSAKNVSEMQVENKKIQQQLRAIHRAKITTVMFIRPYMTEQPTNEMEFQQRACKYTVGDSAKLLDLEGILINGNTKARENKNSHDGFNIGIYLTLQDNSTLKVMFNERGPTDNAIMGEIENASEDHLIIADANVVKKIYQWAAATGIHTHCDDLLK